MQSMLIVVYVQRNQSRAAYPLIFFGGTNPPDERKEGDANEHYILGFVPVVALHCCPCQSMLSDFQGKGIAATTANSDGSRL